MKKLNPQTGLFEDELEPLRADGGAPPVSPVPSPAAAPVAPVTPMFPPKPTFESQTTERQRVKTPEDIEAEKQALLSEGRVANAQERVGDLTIGEAEAVAKGAKDVVGSKEGLLKSNEDAETSRRKIVEQNAAEDDKAIADEKQARIKAGGAREHYYDGKTGARLFHGILQGISEGLQRVRGDSGPNPVAQILEQAYTAHEKNLLGQYDATKEANKQSRDKRTASLAEHDRQRAVAANQALLSIDLIEDQVKAAIAALGPDKAKAANELLLATTNAERARLRQERQDAYAKIIERETTHRSPTSSGSAAAFNKPLSGDVAELADAATQYERLAARQKELTANGIPQYGAEATEWEKNEQAMRSLLQKKFGKSDNDARLAEEQQGSPGFWSKLWSKTPGTNTIDNYHKSLDVNAEQLRASADERIRLEGPEGTQARRTGADKKTGPTPANDNAAPKKQGVEAWSDAEVRGGYQNALSAKNAAATKAFLVEMKRRGIKPSGQ